ncbi:hypothetical protein CEUSTIGMA_g9253.t1 [Chlamydomonas eustigma]|uniref:Uncharacterized protein n=1 Tax=Chlamydomonas eustigma TaxID=1157962 RepID=A0A250XFH2_9CHLO|nr:hypothetical protein CEUSTIGMA_g9253.t1 [Chlamydomonas eustigma]|eukprot:GAX81825.1 hypothetical protein CEUSTIGMA_g9253.t1 [Chlamydomonas eustigma]
MPHHKLNSEDEFYKVARSFPEVHLFFGYGERAQYADVEELMDALSPSLKAIQSRCAGAPFLAVYGGDKAVKERPDLGWLMKRIQDEYNCKLAAVQSAGEPDEHSDFCFVAKQQFETLKKMNSAGQEEEFQQVLYGGTRNGVPVGGARYYLGPEFIASTHGAAPLLKSVFVLGGGGIALEEIQYADQKGVTWVYVPSRARHEEAYRSRYGPVHEWVSGYVIAFLSLFHSFGGNPVC